MDKLLDFSNFPRFFPEILDGFLHTIQLCALSLVLSLLLGTILVAMRVSPTPVLRAAGTAYVNLMRNTPLTLLYIILSFGVLLQLQIKWSSDHNVNSFAYAAFGLSAYTAAFVCEALRSGINTVPMGQAEAARSIGLTFTQSLRLVILPQAFRAVIGPLGSIIIAMIKNSTVATAMGYAEAAFVLKDMLDARAQSVPAIPVFIGFTLGFLVLTLPTGFFFGWLAKRMAVAR